jgi:hypothetical protein
VRREIAVLRATVIAVVLALALAEALVYAVPLQPRLSMGQTLDFTGPSEFSDSFRLVSNYPAHVTHTLFVRNASPTFPTLYFYYDGEYPTSYSNVVDFFGLHQHLQDVLAQRGVSANFSLLNATALQRFLLDPRTHGDLLVIASGALPYTVYTNTTDLLSPWIRAGGTLVWIGDRIGYYSARPFTRLSANDPSVPGYPGSAHFVSPLLFGGVAYEYTAPSNFSDAFGVTYPYSLPANGLSVPLLGLFGGTVVGGIAGEFTNIARVPLGNGSILYFGAPLEDVPQLAIVLANLYEAGVLGVAPTLLKVEHWWVAAGAAVEGTEYVPFPHAAPGASLCSFFFQSDYLATASTVTCLPVT